MPLIVGYAIVFSREQAIDSKALEQQIQGLTLQELQHLRSN
jgi:hypothetical protein